MKVIRITVYYHSPSDNILHRKPIRFYGQICISLTLQQRWQIACMFRMWLVCRVIMTSRCGKVRSGAAFTLMNMKSEKTCFTFLWQAGNLRNNQYASVFLVKLNASGQLRCFYPTTNWRYCIRTISAILHSITSYQSIPTNVFCNNNFRSFSPDSR